MDAFSGRPVWLASASWRGPEGTIATGDWNPEQLRRAKQNVENALAGAGDPAHQRLFRMNITLCLHRACSAAELARLPAEFYALGGGLAGGPIEILESRGMPGLPRELPCEKPGREIIDAARPDLWLPRDCGRCTPCRDRASIRTASSLEPVQEAVT